MGLSISRLLKVTVSLAALAASFLNTASCLIIGESDVIDTQTRFRTYGGGAGALTQIGIDFGSTSPEYLAAQTYFAAKPQPQSVTIGKWAQAATAGRLMGAQLSSTQQAISNFTSITTGALKIAVDGAAAQTVTGLSFAAATTLPGVAAIVSAALTGATCTWNGYQFVIKSSTTGANSSVAFPTAPASGTNIATALGLNQAQGAYSVAGMVAESALAAVQAMDALATPFYHFGFAAPDLQTSDIQAIAAWTDGASNPHIFGYTTSDANALVASATTDIGYLLQQAGYERTIGQYSSTNPYAVFGIFGRSVTINWLGANTAINFMYQPQPGTTPESLVEAQADALDAKRYNYVANYANGVPILENGTMAGPYYLDEVVGSDWLSNYAQVNLFNFMAQKGTKVAQTDAGVHEMVTNLDSSMAQGVTNGLLAPGTWNAQGFGQLAEGDYLPSGWYIYAPPIATQATASRALRQAPNIQIAATFAGAINTGDVGITVNR
jgi:hypothetical protein